MAGLGMARLDNPNTSTANESLDKRRFSNAPHFAISELKKSNNLKTISIIQKFNARSASLFHLPPPLVVMLLTLPRMALIILVLLRGPLLLALDGGSSTVIAFLNLESKIYGGSSTVIAFLNLESFRSSANF